MTASEQLSDLQNTGSILRILWVEDMEDDVNLAERELKKAGLQFVVKRVETREDFTTELDVFKPDIILSDHGLPQFNSVEAFKIYKSSGLTIPFILVTGNVSEEFAVSSFKLGIDDYVLKSKVSRLALAILTALNKRRTENARREREEEIRNQNEKLEEDVQLRTEEVNREKIFTDSIINSMPGIFYVQSHGNFIRWNKNLEIVTGYSPEEIERLNFLSLIAEKDREFAKRQLQTTIIKGSLTFEQNIITKSGKSVPYYFTCLFNKIETTEFIVGTGVDISDLKNTQETLRLHDERMELAFHTSGNAWWDWDLLTGEIDSHPNRYLTLGYSREDMTPHADWWLSLIHPDDREKTANDVEQCLSGKTLTYDSQCRMKTKLGDWKWFHVLGKVVTRGEKDQPLRMIGTVDDITRSKLIEKELLEAKYAAETANRTKGQFLANMSHEIRTPLNAVIGLSHLALKTNPTPKQQDYLKKIQSSSESLLGIINDILDFSKIEAGKLTLEEVSFDLEEVLQKLADVITYKAYGKGLEIAFGIGSDVFTRLVGDPVRLEQVLSNLCSNAVKFTDKGEVVVVAKLLQESDDGVQLQFEVTDTGIGMDKTQLSKLFVPFTQADDSISRKFGGTGLGLSIIKLLVELMNGTVWVKSRPGEGSIFCFTAWFRKQKQQRQIPVPSVDLRKLRVLIVDDNNSAIKILREALESFSFEVTSVNSGIQAIHFLKNNYAHQPVKLVLMDWKMPEMDGLKAAEIIKRDPELLGIKIIMMCTSYANEDIYQKSDELGLSGVLIKPIRYSTLYDTILRAIGSEETKAKKKEQIEIEPVVPDEIESAHVLLVEDNEINQQVASELLEGFGYSVEIASNGLEALNKVKESGLPSRFDLVLMDLQMPVMGGYKATAEIRKLKEYDRLPIIAMTADAMGGVREKCLEVGMVDFITKPINPNHMLEILQKWLKATGKGTAATLLEKKGPESVKIPEMAGINIEEGLRHLNGNSRLYYDLLIKFLDSHQNFIVEVKKEFTRGEEVQGLRLVHTMKGMSANLGMTELHEATMKAERALKAKTPRKFAEILLPLSHELESVLKGLRENLERGSGPSHVVPIKLIKPLLSELNRLLQDQDLEAVTVLKKIGLVKGHEEEMTQIEMAIQKYDFDAAVKILNHIEI